MACSAGAAGSSRSAASARPEEHGDDGQRREVADRDEVGGEDFDPDEREDERDRLSR